MNNSEKKLESELRYLLSEERNIELQRYAGKVNDNNVKEIAKEIYTSRGIDYSKLNKGVFNNLAETINEMITIFKSKEKATRNKMIVQIVYIVLLLILIKIPFDLVRDLGYDYIELLSTNNLIQTLWNFGFLLLYTVTMICTFVVLIRNFNAKFRDAK